MSVVKWSQPLQTSHHVKNLLPTWCVHALSHPSTPVRETRLDNNPGTTGWTLASTFPTVNCCLILKLKYLGTSTQMQVKNNLSPHTLPPLLSSPPPAIFLHYYFFHIPFPGKDTCLIKHGSHCFAPAASSRGCSWGIVSCPTQTLKRDLVTGYTKDSTPTISFKELLYKPPHLLFISLFYNRLFSINVENLIPNKLS